MEILGRSVIVSLGAARGCTIAAGVAGRDNSGAGEEYKIGSGCAPEGIRTPNLLIRRQLRTVRGGLPTFTGVRPWFVNPGSDQRHPAAQVHDSL